jgi:hypothetical protein
MLQHNSSIFVHSAALELYEASETKDKLRFIIKLSALTRHAKIGVNQQIFTPCNKERTQVFVNECTSAHAYMKLY